MSASTQAPRTLPSGPVIAIVGAGFSGTLLALHALRRCHPSARILLIERRARFGYGQAYATGNDSHLLNVPAGRMSAFHDKPDDFLEWLRSRPPGQADDPPPTAGAFVPRRVYGAYVRHLLKQELRRPGTGERLALVHDEVLGLEESGGRLRLRFARRPDQAADFTVLATGSLPPCPPPLADPAFFDTPAYRSDPWASDALAELPCDAGILLIGTGLTTIDLVTSLLDQGHRGPIHAVSRRGLLPECHASAGRVGDAGPALAYPTTPSALLRTLRAEAERVVAAGGNWRSVVDEMRPFTSDIWQAMSNAERRRFLRHGRRWWDVHRHRMAPAVAERIEAALASGQLRVRAGRLQRLAERDGQVTVCVACPGGEATELRVERVINCAGAGAADYQRITHALLRDLLGSGLARPDALRLGLDVTGTGALLSRDGAVSRRLFAVGPPTRGRYWEMTAVPDIRRQCELMAATLASLLRVA